ncbi:MAG: amino acid adenylation domain-containing protein [Gammaproteobacteria bacterium]|nr:amino acid adenylation domain-containing protein [Gammaproteobacteria bacterium]
MALYDISTLDTRKKTTAVDFDPFEFGEVQCTVPSTESQHELWLSVQMGDDANCSFNESISLQMTGALDAAAMQQALQSLVDRHDAFRSTFNADGTIIFINKFVELNTLFVDLTKLPEDERKAGLQKILDSEVELPFNLEHGPLVRAHIIKLADTSFRLVFTAHHIVCDGWSMSCAIRDLGKLYSAASSNVAVELAEPYKFSDYALLEQDEIRNKTNQEAEAYWLDLYADGAPATDLPTDRTRPLIRTYPGRREDLQLDPELVKGLKRVGGEVGCTFLNVLLAGFEAYMYRITGQDDFVVGIPAAGQSATGRTTLVGHCVNILPLRGQIKENTKFRDLLLAVRSSMLDAYESQRYTFGSLVKKLPQNTRDPGRIPLIPLLFNIDQASHEDGFVAEGIEAEFFSNPRHFENFEWTLNVSSSAEKVVFECTYNTNLFDNETIRTRLREYETLLRSIVSDFDQLVDELTILPEQEVALLNSWNATELSYDKQACIHNLVENQVARTPQDTAVYYEDVELSYQELNERANQLAHHLQALGVSPDKLVGVALDRTEQMLVAILGVLKAGGGYVPMDPGYPNDRLSYMLEHSGVEVLVSQSDLLEKLPEHNAQTVCIDSDWQTIGQLGTDNPVTEVKPEHLAYVIYTSGSTGKPKGVQVPHGAVVNFLCSMAEQPGLSAKDRLLAVTTLSFDIAVLELYLPLTVGAQVVIAGREVASDGEQLLKTLQRHNITTMQATPASWRMLLDEGWQGGENFKALVGGEALPRDLANELIDRAELWNMYGPTETTVWSTCEQVTEKEGPILIGKPIGNTQVYVLDAQQQPVPVGVPGELYIAGDGVTRGYLHADELTVEHFTNDPFSESSNSSMYCTGDQVVFHRTGQLEYMGRLDNQVKLRGFRIELGEIESVLLTSSAVKEAVVDVKELSPGDMRLVAFLVMNDGVEFDTEAARLVCQAELPEYMIPQHFISLDALPLTLNGKIDRKSLPIELITDNVAESIIVEPVTVIDKKLAEIWKSVLKLDCISMTDNFFNLGGHSLLANKIITQIRKELKVSIPLTFLFEFPTLQLMTDNLPLDKDAGTLIPPGIEKRLNPFPATLSTTQHRLWFLQELYPDSALFNQVGVWKIHGEIDRTVFSQAVSELVNRQLILNSRISLLDGSPVMVKKENDHTLEIDDFQFSSKEVMDLELMNFVETKAEMPLDFKSGQYIRIHLVELSDNVQVMVVVSHPIIWDGWSFDILLNELSAIYGALLNHRADNLSALPINYMDFPEWHRSWMASGVEQKQLDFWKANLKGASTHIALPRDRARSGLPTYQGSRVSLFLEKDYIRQITDLAHLEGVTLYMVMLSAFFELLEQYSRQRDITIATQVQGRVRPEFESILGPFVNTVLLRNRTGQSLTHRQMIQLVRKTCVDAFNHQDVPFEKVLDQADLARAEKNAPPYQIMFTFQDTTNRSMKFADLELTQINPNAHTAYTDIIFWLKETGAGLYGGFDYSTELFDLETISKFHDDYLQILSGILAAPDSLISQEATRAEEPVHSASPGKKTDKETTIDDEVPLTQSVQLSAATVTKAGIEKKIVALWEEALEIDDIESFDNFFELGGHSLSSMQVLEKIKKETGVQVPPRSILMDSLSQIVEYCYHEITNQPDDVQNVSLDPSLDEADTSVDDGAGSISRNIKSKFFGSLGFLKSGSKKEQVTTLTNEQKEYEDYFSSATDKNLFRGVYHDFVAALSTAPVTKDTGYDHSEPAKMYKDRLDQIYPSDYPVIFWLERAFKKGAASVIDFGGHVGVAYYAYQKYISYPDNLDWLVCDVEEVTLEGKRVAERKEDKVIDFTTDVKDGDGKDVFFASGSLQYMENSLAEMLADYKQLPKHIIVNLLPVHDDEEFYTLQNIGFSFCPYHIFKADKFVGALQSLGYEIVDKWKNPEKECLIPFNKQQSLDYYSGFYLRSTR